MIGLAVGTFVQLTAYSEELDLVVPVNPEGSLNNSMGALLFTQADCQGQAYLGPAGKPFGGALIGPYLPSGSFFAVRREVETGLIPVLSESGHSSGTCMPNSTTIDLGLPADEITEPLPFTIPFPLPIYVAPIAP